MSYLDVITLEEARSYLKIDDDVTEDDSLISTMIGSALQTIEINTNHIMFQRNKTYYRTVDAPRIVVFDYPINDYDTDVAALHYSLRHEYKADKITLDVGYKTKQEVPNALIQVALSMIAGMYYSYENNEARKDAEDYHNRVMFTYRRSIVS